MTRSAFIAIIGKPNVGKSSILNRLTGSKIAIVSSKPQTTRTKIMGVLTRDEVQLVFTDTPGFHHAHNKLGEHMNQAVGDTVGGVDACLFVVEPKGELNDKEQELLAMCKKQRLPVILAINKIDMLRDKTELAPRIGQLAGLYDFTAVVPCSAQTGEGVQDLLTEMERLALPSPHFFPDDTLTDQPERVLAAEMIREKILRLMDKEIPHGIAVVVERFKERPDKDLIDIDVDIYCERKSHKGMIIGKGGQMLKKIASAARMDIEELLGVKVNLQCWVKVREDWRDNEQLLNSLGFAKP